MKNDQRRNFLKKAALGISGVAGISLLSQTAKAGETSIPKGKIIALNTSHRAGKTSFASLKIVLDSVQKVLPEVESEIIELANLDFGFPIFDGTQPKDDLDEVIEKITALDCRAIVIASPVYFALPTARCVAFIDRLSDMRRTWKLKNKILGLVTVANAQNSGQETVLHCLHNSLVTLQMIPAVDAPPTAHWGAALWNRTDSIEADRQGKETAINLGKRIAELIQLIA